MRRLTVPLGTRRIHSCLGLVSLYRVAGIALIDVFSASLRSLPVTSALSKDHVMGVVAQVIVYDLDAFMTYARVSSSGIYLVVVANQSWRLMVCV